MARPRRSRLIALSLDPSRTVVFLQHRFPFRYPSSLVTWSTGTVYGSNLRSLAKFILSASSILGAEGATDSRLCCQWCRSCASLGQFETYALLPNSYCPRARAWVRREQQTPDSAANGAGVAHHSGNSKADGNGVTGSDHRRASTKRTKFDLLHL
jgi:hypothetical protein